MSAKVTKNVANAVLLEMEHRILIADGWLAVEDREVEKPATKWWGCKLPEGGILLHKFQEPYNFYLHGVAGKWTLGYQDFSLDVSGYILNSWKNLRLVKAISIISDIKWRDSTIATLHRVEDKFRKFSPD